RGRDSGDAGVDSTGQPPDISGYVDQQFQAWRDAEPQPAVAAVKSGARALAGGIDPVLALNAAGRDHEARIGHVGTIGCDLRSGRGALARLRGPKQKESDCKAAKLQRKTRH